MQCFAAPAEQPQQSAQVKLKHLQTRATSFPVRAPEAVLEVGLGTGQLGVITDA